MPLYRDRGTLGQAFFRPWAEGRPMETKVETLLCFHFWSTKFYSNAGQKLAEGRFLSKLVY